MKGFILPTTHSHIPKVVAVLDTSGSMGKEEIDLAVTELYGIFKSITRPFTMISVDTEVSNKSKVSGKKFNVSGGGGTDMVVGLEAAQKLNPDIIILLTDGYTPWPKVRLKSDLIVVLVGKTHAAVDTVPSWAKVLVAE